MKREHPMRPTTVLAALLALGAAGASACAAAAEPSLVDNLPRFLGRLHPVVVHFPIALLIAGAGFEIFSLVFGKDRAKPSAAGLACVIVGALGAGVAVWAGWVNADLETHSKGAAGLMETHRWLGIAAAVLAGVAMVCALLGAGGSRAMTAVYRVSLVLAAGVVGVAGHWGGSMVYGEDYITEALFPSPPPAAPDEEAQLAELAQIQAELEASGTTLTVDFATQIAPIFAGRCVQCHGPDKQKGNLRLDDRRFVFDERSADAQVIIPGDALASDLFFLVGLPHDDPDAMPPEGEAEPLSAEELALLETWIDEGAVWLDIPIVAAPREVVAEAPTTQPAEPAFVFDDAAKARQAEAFAALAERGAVALRVSLTEPWAEVRFDLLGESLADEDLALLEPLKPTLTSLNLAGTGVTDDALGALAGFPRLAKLNLGRTGVTDAGIAALAGHPALRYLNLYGTQVTDQGLVSAASLPALESLYLWDTGVSPQAGALLAALKPGLTVEVGGELTPVSFDEVGAPAEDAEASAEAQPEPQPEPPAEEPRIELASLPGCCRAAVEAGGECDHPCCVEARANGEICPTCAG